MVSAFVKRIGIGSIEEPPEKFVPSDPESFSEDVVIHYGNSENDGANYVHVRLCSITWLQDHMAADAVLRGQNLLIMKRYDGRLLRSALENYAEKCRANSVRETYAKLARLGSYEFEDFNDPNSLPTFFIDEKNEASPI